MSELSKYTLTKDQIDNLAAQAKKHRDARLIETMYYLASRVGETVTLTRRQLIPDHRPPRVEFPDRKNSTEGIIPLTNEMLFSDLQRLAKQGQTIYCFESRQSGHISTRQAQRIIEQLGYQADIDHPAPSKSNLTPHLLRHSRARHLKD